MRLFLGAHQRKAWADFGGVFAGFGGGILMRGMRGVVGCEEGFLMRVGRWERSIAETGESTRRPRLGQAEGETVGNKEKIRRHEKSRHLR